MHWSLEGAPLKGELVVAAAVAGELTRIFEAMFVAHFPIERMRPIWHYQGSDAASMTDNNSSAFNCRLKVGSQTELSVHSLGRAVDINPLYNPYESGGRVLPSAGRRYSRLSASAADLSHPAVIHADGVVVRAFEREGWTWGGRWQDPQDWHHFEKP